LLAELQFELWMGDVSEIRRKRERKQKTDRQDVAAYSELLLKADFLAIWVPNWEYRDLRQTTLASTPDGAGAHPAQESTASRN